MCKNRTMWELIASRGKHPGKEFGMWNAEF